MRNNRYTVGIDINKEDISQGALVIFDCKRLAPVYVGKIEKGIPFCWRLKLWWGGAILAYETDQSEPENYFQIEKIKLQLINLHLKKMNR